MAHKYAQDRVRHLWEILDTIKSTARTGDYVELKEAHTGKKIYSAFVQSRRLKKVI
jgi:hypothetical protein